MKINSTHNRWNSTEMRRGEKRSGRRKRVLRIRAKLPKRRRKKKEMNEKKRHYTGVFCCECHIFTAAKDTSDKLDKCMSDGFWHTRDGCSRWRTVTLPDKTMQTQTLQIK